MAYVKVVEADPRLPHQIIIASRKGTHLLTVSCNCMPVANAGYRKPMMTFASGTELLELNIAWLLTKQHRTHRAPFDSHAIAAARRGQAYRLT